MGGGANWSSVIIFTYADDQMTKAGKTEKGGLRVDK